MKALVIEGDTARLDQARSVSATQPGWALIEVSRASLSPQDIEDNGAADARVPGYQCAGVVRDVADSEHRKWVGKRVITSRKVVCGSCDMCLAGLRKHCREVRLIGSSALDGCLAQFFTAPIMNCVELPDSIDDDHAVFANDVASALQALRQLTIEGKPYITILGDTPMGMLCAQLMSSLNASVRVIGRSSERLALCEKWNVKHRHVDDIGRRADQDVVIDCTGLPEGLEVAMKLVRPRGIIMLKLPTLRQKQLVPGVDLTPVIHNEFTIVGSAGGSLIDVIPILEKKQVDVLSLIGQRVRLDHVAPMLDALCRPDAMKIMIDI